MTATKVQVQGPPTEEEVRELLKLRRDKYKEGDRHLEEAVIELFDLIDYQPLTAEDAEAQYPHTALGDYIWHNLRPSEWIALREIVSAARDGAEAECHVLIGNAVVTAALEFAKAYPDAPRAPKGWTVEG